MKRNLDNILNKFYSDNYGEDKMVALDYTPNNDETLVFNQRYYHEVKELMNKFEVKKLRYVATDGISRIIASTVNNMTNEEYDLYIKYHFSVCERDDLIGYSGHILSIVQK